MKSRYLFVLLGELFPEQGYCLRVTVMDINVLPLDVIADDGVLGDVAGIIDQHIAFAVLEPLSREDVSVLKGYLPEEIVGQVSILAVERRADTLCPGADGFGEISLRMDSSNAAQMLINKLQPFESVLPIHNKIA